MLAHNEALNISFLFYIIVIMLDECYRKVMMRFMIRGVHCFRIEVCNKRKKPCLVSNVVLHRWYIKLFLYIFDRLDFHFSLIDLVRVEVANTHGHPVKQQWD